MSGPASITLAALAERHAAHAAVYYRSASGRPTGEAANYATMRTRFLAFATAQLGHGATASQISKGLVASWRDAMAAEQLARPYINQQIRRLRTMLRWANDLELLPDEVVTSVRLVQPLRANRSRARESVAKRPASLSDQRKIFAILAPNLRDVAKTLSLTAARPGEILSLTTREIVRLPNGFGQIVKVSHKTASRGKTRVIPLCPLAMAILERHLRPLVLDAYLFPTVGRSNSEHITTGALRKALARACGLAGVPRVRPYDIRRATARVVRAAHGLDAAQALLGHSNASTTEIYAPIDSTDGPTFRLAQQAAEALVPPTAAAPRSFPDRPQALGGLA